MSDDHIVLLRPVDAIDPNQSSPIPDGRSFLGALGAFDMAAIRR